MNNKNYFRNWGILGCIFLILSGLSICFFDKPLSLYLHKNSFDRLHYLSYITEYGIPAWMLFCLSFVFILNCIERTVMANTIFIVYVVIVVILAHWLRDKLGIALGRNWPLTWSGSGPYGSLITNNHYSFHFLQSSSFVGSYPSGHAIVMTTLCCSFYLRYKRYLMLWILPVIILSICLVVLNYHYLGDVFAGIGLGLLISSYGYKNFLLKFFPKKPYFLTCTE